MISFRFGNMNVILRYVVLLKVCVVSNAQIAVTS